MVFLGMLSFWAILYTIINHGLTFKQLSKKKSNDTKNRIVSITHGLITFIWSCYLYLPYPIYG